MKSTGRAIEAKRLARLPIYPFEELAAKRREQEAKGIEVIDLSIGDPDIGAPRCVIHALKTYAEDRPLHSYTPDWVIRRFNRSVSAWFSRRFGLELDPDDEILPLIGTKEGLAHLPLAILNQSEIALVPDPGYPVYGRSVMLVDGLIEAMPLLEENRYLPDLEGLVRKDIRIIYLNYPNNPTSAVADRDFFAKSVELARAVGAIVVNDAAYSEIVFDGHRSPSILECEGARDVAVEFHSFSKTFSMAGWRAGFVAGSADVIRALRKLKSNVDSGVFGAILLATVAALESGWDDYWRMLEEYEKRRSMVFAVLKEVGLSFHPSNATFYIWAKTPGDMKSEDFASLLLEQAGILVAPGLGFGRYGEGHFRISLTCSTDRVMRACERIGEGGRFWKT